MNVGELIAALQQYDSSLAVCIPNAEGDYDEVLDTKQEGVVFLPDEDPIPAEPVAEQCVILVGE